MRGKDLDKMIGRANRSISTSGRVLQHDSGLSTVLSIDPETVLQFAMLMTEDEVNADSNLSGEQFGFRTRKTTLSSGTEVDDDMLSAWCYIVTINPMTNIRSKRKEEPVLVYFPLISQAMMNEMEQECVSIGYGEVFAIVWNHADARWESLRVRNQGDTMDVITVCDSSKPAESCSGDGDTEGEFCCLFDGMAFRLLPDCEASPDAMYFCAPSSEQFSVWVYAPDKRALPPEGICDWGRRVQDAYTIQEWKPWGANGPAISSTRPVYQVAACVCNCPHDSATIELWCSDNPSSSVKSQSFTLRKTEGANIPEYDEEEDYDRGALVKTVDGDTVQYWEAFQDVPEGIFPEANSEYWTEIEFEDELSYYEGEFKICHEVPMVVSEVTYRGDDAVPGHDGPSYCEDGIGFVAWDPETGEPIKFWCNDGNADPDVSFLPPNFAGDWEITGDQCRLASEMGEAFEEEMQSVCFWYRVRLFCTLMTTDSFGIMNTVNYVQIFLIVPPGHYGESPPGTSLSSPSRLISGASTATNIRSCMGRVIGIFEDSDLGSGGVDPDYENTRYTPFLSYHRLMGCGYVQYDENGAVTGYCMCDPTPDCPAPQVYFEIDFNCNMANPV